MTMRLLPVGDLHLKRRSSDDVPPLKDESFNALVAAGVDTHHPPLADCADVYCDCAPWWTPAFYGSDLLPVLPEEIQPDVWIFGHVHAAFDVRCGKTRAVCNPVEGGNFNPHLIIEI